MALKWPTKDPDEVLDYQINWARRVQSSRTPDDAIASSTWIVPAGITKQSDSFADTATTIWLTGGTEDESYTLINRIVTADNRTMDQSVSIRIKTK